MKKMDERIEILEEILSQTEQAKYMKNTVYFEMVEKWKSELKKLKTIKKIREF
jgi:hypothetical protein